MRHEMLTHFCHHVNTKKKGHAESAFRDACHTSSGPALSQETVCGPATPYLEVVVTRTGPQLLGGCSCRKDSEK
jgi:hypothetical protein